MNKQTAIDSLKDMPQEFDVEDLIERLILLEKIEKGRNDVRDGHIFSHEEAKSKMGKWLK